MPPKKATSTSARVGRSGSARSEEPLSEPEQLHDSDSEKESVTPLSKTDHRRILDRLAFLEARELQRQAAPTLDPVRTKEPKLAPPPEFYGKLSEYRNFMAQVALTFTLCPRTYSDDKSQVLFVISRLRGRLLNWAREIATNPQHPYHNNYEAFKAALDNIYLDRNYRELCEDKLHGLTVTSSVAAYAAEFQSLVEALDWNDGAKCSAFYSKLPSAMKDSMAIVGRATTFDALVSQAIALDQRVRQARHEKNPAPPVPDVSRVNRPFVASSKPPFRESDPLRSLHPLSRTQFKPPPTVAPNKPPSPPSSTPGTLPPQPGPGPREPLSEDEKTRHRQKGLCVYCGDPNHICVNCPRRLAHEARISVMHFHHPEPHFEPEEPSESENYRSQAPPRSEA